jgi:hypothetical protein
MTAEELQRPLVVEMTAMQGQQTAFPGYPCYLPLVQL